MEVVLGVGIVIVSYLFIKSHATVNRMTDENRALLQRVSQLERQCAVAIERLSGAQKALLDAEALHVAAKAQVDSLSSELDRCRTELKAAAAAAAESVPSPSSASPPLSPKKTIRVRRRSTSISQGSSSPLKAVATAAPLLIGKLGASTGGGDDDSSDDDGDVTVVTDSDDKRHDVLDLAVRTRSIRPPGKALLASRSNSSGTLLVAPETSELTSSSSSSMSSRVAPVPRSRAASIRASVDVQQLWTQKWQERTALLVRVQSFLRRTRAQTAYRVRRHRVNILTEILETERHYVAHLQRLVDICRDLLAQCLLPQRSVVKIFVNVEILFEFNREFLDILGSTMEQARDRFDAKIANVFLYVAFNWRAYHVYVNNYADALALARKLEKQSPQFKEFVSKQSGKLDLYDLLIEPVQRVPRYVLLLTELVKHTPDTHADWSALQLALQEMRSLATFVNSGSRERLAEIAPLLVGWRSFPSAIDRLCASEGIGTASKAPTDADNVEMFLHPARRLVKEGHALASDGKLRLLFLLSDHLLVCKTKGKNKIKVKQMVVLTGASTLATDGDTDFLVNNCRFRLQSVEGRQAWFAAIHSAIQEQEAIERTRI
jgi:hypothetical protein